MNFKNGGFVFEFNPVNKAMYTGAIEKQVNDAIAAFKAQSGTVKYTTVDYTKL